MKRTVFHNACKVFLASLNLAMALPLIAADTGQINYQARLLDSYGRRVNGTVDLSFKIYDAATDGNLLWSETHSNVTVQDGVYAVALGSESALPASVFSQNNVYLELGIDSETMSPRQQMTAAAYALVARTIMGSNIFENQTNDYVGIGTTNPAVKLDVNGTIKATGFKMTTGAVDNYVLVSDANGAGTWQPISIVIAERDPIFTNWVQTVFIPVTNVLNTRVGNLEGATNALQVQATTLQAATNVLNTSLSAETAARAGTGAALSNSVNTLQGATGALNTAISTEATARGNADAGISNAYIAADTVVSNGIINERTVRDAADAGISNTINTRAVMWDNAVVMKQGAGSISYSNVYYLASGTTWSNANANTNLTAQGLLGIALGSSIANNGLLLNGNFSNGWNFAVGSVIYLDTNNNALTTTMPTGTNNIVRVVGYAVSETNIYFNPDRTFVEIIGQ